MKQLDDCLAVCLNCLSHCLLTWSDCGHLELVSPRIFSELFLLFYRASSPLAQLYSTSTMEHHHFDQCLMILNSPGNQILSNVSPEEYSRVVKVLEDAILSTDLAVYFRLV